MGLRVRAARRQRLARRSFTRGRRRDPLRPGRDQERGRGRDRVHRADARGETARFAHARRLLRARGPAPGQPARDREPDQGGRVRLAAEHARRPPGRAATRRWRPASASSATATRARSRSSTCWAAAPRRRRRADRGGGRGVPEWPHEQLLALREGGARLLPLRPSARALPGRGATRSARSTPAELAAAADRRARARCSAR